MFFFPYFCHIMYSPVLALNIKNIRFAAREHY